MDASANPEGEKDLEVRSELYLGADAVLTKPFQPAELLKAIGSVLTTEARLEN
jgi:DNA-binding response OmpR family regulator